ncbi:UDP-N-acetylglucosamine transferase subunit ALG13 [Rhodococcus sp. OK519]|uniref:glycosyltransferase n=1 Tax=Rhodococcus sp. OK519 TaxID=2135729 RepID=UPI000D466AB2|nr:UDP-N-acetylglucosamine transferase subunit ALG13 [Rhodococcus sp. OK519]
MLAASTGGHLAQLVRLAPTLNASDDSLWVTFDSEQSRSLLAGKNTLLVPYIAPRDWRGVFSAYGAICKALKYESDVYDGAFSTGAALALAALPAARRNGIKACYIESVSRTQGPSVSGRILEYSRLVELRAQHPGWATGRWSYQGSVMNAFTSSAGVAGTGTPRIFVTLGTIRPYRFDAMVDAVLATGLANESTTWQLGCTRRNQLPGRVTESIPDDEFAALIAESDVVITHSGVGTILKILEMGKHPIVIPRRSHRNEHVDDHQSQIADLVHHNGVATAVEVDQLTPDMIVAASGRRVAPRETS